MPLDDLVELASTLKVSLSAIAVPSRRRILTKSRPASAAAADGHVLRGDGIGSIISANEGNRRLEAITNDDNSADWAESELVGAGELVRRLGIARGTLDNWRRLDRIVALRKGLRNFVYPLRQFDRRRPVDGLDQVVTHFASAEEAWEWLVAPNRMTSEKPPIDLLHADEVERVVSAAAGAFDYA